jgi:acyl carrier protein
VNIAGHRVNPAEVESAVARQPYVLDNVTLARPGADKEPRLVTYLVPRGGAPTLEQLCRDLRRELPEYMLPRDLVVTGQLPLSPNGKVDTAALPATGQAARSAAAPIAPRTDIESRVADVWRAVLQADAVGIDASFFDLGGTSILMTQVQQRLELELRREVPITGLFAHPTVRTLAAYLSRQEPEPPNGPRGNLIAAVPDSRRRLAVRHMLRRELQQMGDPHDD